MASNTYNFLGEGVNRIPLFTRSGTDGESSINNSGDHLSYAFGIENPNNINFDLGTAPGENTIQSNWGRHDVAGIKRNFSDISDESEDLDIIQEETGVYIRNTSEFIIDVWGFFGNTFDPARRSFPENEESQNVGYWAKIFELPGEGAFGEENIGMIQWYKDQYENQMERIYFQIQSTAGTSLDGLNAGQLESVETAAIANSAGDDLNNLYVVPMAGTQINKGEQILITDNANDKVYIVEEDGVPALFGSIRENGVWHSEIMPTESLNQWSLGTSFPFSVVGMQPNRAYIVLDTLNGPDNYIIEPDSIVQDVLDTTFGGAGSQATITFTLPATINGSSYTPTKAHFLATAITNGVFSGTVEGSFLSGATVTAKDAQGIEMVTTTNESGYYEFPRAAVGLIESKGGTNLMTGETDSRGVDGGKGDVICTFGAQFTNSSMGGTISPVSTLIVDLQKNEGLSEDEAIETLVSEGKELFDLPQSIASKSKMREYLKIGLTGYQNSDDVDESNYTGFIQFSKKIAEQEQSFVDNNLEADIDERKKERASNAYRQNLTRLIKRKKDGDLNKFKNDYLTKAGSDNTISNIDLNRVGGPSKKDQFLLVVSSAIEDVDGFLRDDEKLASSKEDFKNKARQLTEELIDNDEVVDTTGLSYEDIAIKYNEAYVKRKFAAKETAGARYTGSESSVSFVNKKASQTYQIVKESDGYRRSGQIVKKIKEAKTNIATTLAKTANRFLESSIVGQFKIKISINGITTSITKGSGTIGRLPEPVLPATNYVIKNPGFVEVHSSAPGFDANYQFLGGPYISYKGRGATGLIEYKFLIHDSSGARIKPVFDLGSSFRTLVESFLTFAANIPELVATTVYAEMLTWSQIPVIADADRDGVADSEDEYPNFNNSRIDEMIQDNRTALGSDILSDVLFEPMPRTHQFFIPNNNWLPDSVERDAPNVVAGGSFTHNVQAVINNPEHFKSIFNS